MLAPISGRNMYSFVFDVVWGKSALKVDKKVFEAGKVGMIALICETRTDTDNINPLSSAFKKKRTCIFFYIRRLCGL